MWPTATDLDSCCSIGIKHLLILSIGLRTDLKKKKKKSSNKVSPRCNWWTESPMKAQREVFKEQKLKALSGLGVQSCFETICQVKFSTWKAAQFRERSTAGVGEVYSNKEHKIIINTSQEIDILNSCFGHPSPQKFLFFEKESKMAGSYPLFDFRYYLLEWSL